MATRTAQTNAPGKLKVGDCEPSTAAKGEIDEILLRHRSALRYAVIFALTKRQNGFYNCSTACWEWNRLPAGALFLEKEIAEAACAALNVLRRRRAQKSVICPKTRPLQVARLRLTRKSCVFVGKVCSRIGTYVPGRLRRSDNATVGGKG